MILFIGLIILLVAKIATSSKTGNGRKHDLRCNTTMQSGFGNSVIDDSSSSISSSDDFYYNPIYSSMACNVFHSSFDD